MQWVHYTQTYIMIGENCVTSAGNGRHVLVAICLWADSALLTEAFRYRHLRLLSNTFCPFLCTMYTWVSTI